MGRWIGLALLLFACAAGAGSPHGELEQRVVEVAERVQPSVVHIESIVKFGDRRNQVTGSGVIVTPQGSILTNEHLVDKAEKVTVTVPGIRRKFSAEVVGSDRQTDIALIRISHPEPLPAASIGNADGVRVGQWVLAIGNPYGLDGTVSLGIVSAKGRNLDVPHLLNDFIQTDAMIDQGSSGGPLVDLDARVIGINSRGQGRGIGFTIPIDTAKIVMAQLERGGVERGYLGITFQALDRELADYFGVPDATGVVVNSIVPGSPAAGAGIAPRDIITRVDGVAVEAEKEEDLNNFQRLVAGLPPGRKVRIELLRAGAPQRVDLELGSQPKITAAEADSDLGFTVQEITDELAREHRLDSSRGAFVLFVARGSPAREAGLQVGDVIVQVEQASVGTLDEFRNAMASVAGAPRFLIQARRGDETKFLLLRPGARPAESPPEATGETSERNP
ncbi:MAG TPA: trypsin-like peptidase domain-containing protein [Myxococcota bacterium]|nr:trypsin-like peptidase domain-containing protein [Myxococcota bacterium]